MNTKNFTGGPGDAITVTAPNPVPRRTTVATTFSPQLGEQIPFAQAGSRQVVFNDPTGRRSVIKDPKTGQFFMIGHDKLQRFQQNPNIDLSASASPLSSKDALYFMKNTPKGQTYYNKNMGENMGPVAKQTYSNMQRPEGSYHASGKQALVFKRKGGILYKTE